MTSTSLQQLAVGFFFAVRLNASGIRQGWDNQIDFTNVEPIFDHWRFNRYQEGHRARYVPPPAIDHEDVHIEWPEFSAACWVHDALVKLNIENPEAIVTAFLVYLQLRSVVTCANAPITDPVPFARTIYDPFLAALDEVEPKMSTWIEFYMNIYFDGGPRCYERINTLFGIEIDFLEFDDEVFTRMIRSPRFTS